jgi:hypothetical protein
VGIERVGFVTLTFLRPITSRELAQERFHSFKTGFLARHIIESVAVPERQGNGGFHFHLAAVFDGDIRNGFDFDALSHAAALKREHNFKGSDGLWHWTPGKHEEFRHWERVYFMSANQRLRRFWSDLREVSAGYGFGRCETLPVISNATAVARYVGAYVTTASNARTADDKGMRTVRYSLTQRAASLKFSWADGNGRKWRRGLKVLGAIFNLDLDGLVELFGSEFQYQLRKSIFVLAENFDEAFVAASQLPDWTPLSERVGFLFNYVAAVRVGATLELQINEAIEQSIIECPF